MKVDTEEEFLSLICSALSAGVRVFPANAPTALGLAQRGFIIKSADGSERQLSVDELEYICARERGNVH